MSNVRSKKVVKPKAPKVPEATAVPSMAKQRRQPPADDDDTPYSALLTHVRSVFTSLTAVYAEQPLLLVSSEGLYDMYLDGFGPPGTELRAQYNCNTCRRFIDRLGGLCVVVPGGGTKSVLWSFDGCPGRFGVSMHAMAKAVAARPVEAAFVSADPMLGVPYTDGWTHFSVALPEKRIWKSRAVSASQRAAARKEQVKDVGNALDVYTPETLEKAIAWLESEALYRGTEIIGPAKWLRDLAHKKATLKKYSYQDALWAAVCSAPDGFCHPRASMIGTLLDDISSGVPFDTAKRKFAEKMHPLKYQRPQAAPKAGAIVEAERLFEKLGLARSLERRLCRIDDFQALWVPQRPAEPRQGGTGLFAGVTPRGATPGAATPVYGEPNVPPTVITWKKFSETVLPTALHIAHRVVGGFATFTTAVHPDAPPMLSWDHPDARNPVAWSFWHFANGPREYGLTPNSWHDVEVIALSPELWGGRPALPGREGVVFVIEGARDQTAVGSPKGGGLFPEHLRGELHGVRAVIEAYNKTAVVAGRGEPHACGVFLQNTAGKKGQWGVVFRVTARDGSVRWYSLDRWD